jgi:hypothetical protein
MATQIQSGLVATGSIGATEIATSGVTTNDINDSAVTAAKLQSSASDNSQRAVGTNHIQNSSVTTDKLANSSVTADKLASSSSLVPLGAILMWSGTTTPDGWQLCNGTDLPSTSPLRPNITKTPDLRDRFIVGATSGGDGVYPGVGVNQTGGSADAVVVSHGHAGSTTDPQGEHRHFVGTFGTNLGRIENYGNNLAARFTLSGFVGNDPRQDYTGGGSTNDANVGGSSSAGSHSHNVTVTPQGVSGLNQNLPPYHALAFIMRVS